MVPELVYPALQYVEKGISDTLRDVTKILNFVFLGQPKNANRDRYLMVANRSLARHKAEIAESKRKIKQVTLNYEKALSRKNRNANPLQLGTLFIRNPRLVTGLLMAFIIIPLVFWFTQTPFENFLLNYENAGKLCILLVIISFPLYFILPRANGAADVAILSICLAIFFSFVFYGFFRGWAVIILLFILPLFRLNNQDNSDSVRAFETGFIRTVTVGLFITSIFVTREFIWLVGLTIWITYLVFLRSTSYRYFRQNYDIVEELYPGAQNRNQRTLFFAGALITSTLLLTTGIVGKLETAFVSSVYANTATFALALVTILLAVQAIIPGINVWASETAVDKRIREMRSMIRLNQGLGGFMSSFFFLFIFSVVGWLITQRSSRDIEFVVDLSYERNFSQMISVFDLIFPWTPDFQFSPEVTLVSFGTLLFAVSACLAIYSAFQLYYLFTTASIFLLPVQDALLSNAVHIEQVNVNLTEHTQKKSDLEEFVPSLLASEKKLNGYVVDQVNIITDLHNTDHIRISVSLEMDFISLDKVLELCQATFQSLFDSYKARKIPMPIAQASFAVYRDTHTMGRHNVFSLQIDRSEWDFLSKDMPGFSLEYKVRHVLKAKLIDFILPDAQIF